MEWEWIDVAQSAWFFEGNPRWLEREWGLMMGQNVIRFVPGVLVSIAGVWMGGAWNGALAMTWLLWLGACAAMHRLYLIHCSSEARRGAAVAALLTAASPGFSAFAGNIDAHQFGYAAAPLGLLALQRTVSYAGLVIFICNATLELAPPLLSMLWLHHMPLGLLAWRGRPRNGLITPIRTTVEFVALQSCWWVLAHIGSTGRIVPYNEGLTLLASKLVGSGIDTTPVDLANRTALAIADSFGGVALVASAIGFGYLRPQARWWSALWFAVVVAGALATRGHARIVYLAFPAVYLAAAAGIDGAGRFVGSIVGHLLRPAVENPSRRRALSTATHAAFATGVLALAFRLTFGDLLGDLSLARVWWR